MAYEKDNVPRTTINLSDFETSWITDRFSLATIEFAEKFGKYLVENRLTTSQIRNIFGEVKRIQANFSNEGNTTFEKDFLLLRPKIAYAAKRAGSRGIEDFKKVMDTAHLAVIQVNEHLVEERKKNKNEEGEEIKALKLKVNTAFQNFVDFFEAILAYHKASGGKE